MTWALAAACAVASVPAGLRWLRVAQREHYLAPSVSRFAWRWWTSSPVNITLGLLGVVGVVGVLIEPWIGFFLVLAQAGPVGLRIQGQTSPLAWTGRLKRLAVVTAVVLVLAYVIGGLTKSALLVVVALFLLPAIVDFVMVILTPVERRMGNRWVDKAAAKLKSSGARVVAITGSYGKTTTKGYVEHLLSGSLRTVASPASFNNRMGLARAINEHLVVGTEVFVAEMGTYGPGEIAELCRWIEPDVAAMVAIGPVHLERFHSEERIVEAKSEILGKATTGVISVDHPLLAALVKEKTGSLDLVTASAVGNPASVAVEEGVLRIGETSIGPIDEQAFEINLAVAVGICVALGVEGENLADRIAALPKPDHRQTESVSERGFAIIDDTYNSNPAGAAAALAALGKATHGGRSVVVTPGMVELGKLQYAENARFAASAAAMADDLVVVGVTNRRALLEGSAQGSASVTVVADRAEAVEWVRANLGPGDAVLYENDLPDHYP